MLDRPMESLGTEAAYKLTTIRIKPHGGSEDRQLISNPTTHHGQELGPLDGDEVGPALVGDGPVVCCVSACVNRVRGSNGNKGGIE